MDVFFKMSRAPGPVSIPFAADRRVEVRFVDSTTGDVIEDCTGDNAILMSDLLANLPDDKLDELSEAIAIEAIKIIKGLV